MTENPGNYKKMVRCKECPNCTEVWLPATELWHKASERKSFTTLKQKLAAKRMCPWQQEDKHYHRFRMLARIFLGEMDEAYPCENPQPYCEVENKTVTLHIKTEAFE